MNIFLIQITLILYVTLMHLPVAMANEQTSAGARAYQSSCAQCHGVVQHKAATGSGETARQAPPMHAVKKRYIKEYSQREAFVTAIKDWINQPDAKKARMHHAVHRFGLMPPPNIDGNSAQLIAEFIFDTEFTHEMGHSCPSKKSKCDKHRTHKCCKGHNHQ
ncbi:MAG TPA: hypothetical protein DCZ03_10205 [Gammaproteobacteria bacterium]|nr:hypothetical protein [Gammaproteobacteria bacterium]